MSVKNETVANSAIPIPNPPDPNKWICVTMIIPDSTDHRSVLLGAISNLATWRVWRRDLAKNAKKVAALWAKTYQSIKFVNCGDLQPVENQFEETTMAGVRTDCNCDAFVQCPDGTEKQLALKSDVPNPQNSSGGAPQPPPGGGTQEYCKTMNASGKMLLPVTVSTGDKISLSTATGQGNDGGTGLWYCPDGHQWFGNQCVPYGQATSGGDPLPTAFHMSIIVELNGTFYDISSADVTVPGGVSNAQVVLQVNDSNIFDNSGSYEICVTVTNNQASMWTHVFDFTHSPGGWNICSGCDGVWSAGVGFVTVLDGPEDNLAVHLIIPAGSFLSWSAIIDANATFVGAGSYHHVEFFKNPSPTFDTINVTLGSNSYASTHSPSIGEDLGIQVAANPLGTGGNAVLKSITITGTGTDPF